MYLGSVGVCYFDGLTCLQGSCDAVTGWDCGWSHCGRGGGMVSGNLEQVSTVVKVCYLIERWEKGY
jgi:hypothetical protein